MSSPTLLDELILRAQKPSRYVGLEFGSVHKDLSQVELKFALAFPDTYEVGMSNLGFRLLYHALNDRDDVACERLFLPWPDLGAILRENGLPLFTLESRAPVRDFDILGITLQFELCYTSCLALLDDSGIPLLAKDRREGDPIVLGGGPCAYNPEPISDFFDCFAIGEGEEVVLEIADAVAAWKGSGGRRSDLLDALARIQGVYVPSLFTPRYDPATRVLAALEPRRPGYDKATRRIIPDLNRLPRSAYTRPLVPFMQTVHDRLPVELQRGCTRGCRFCQVGMISRPTRQRHPREVLDLVEKGIQSSGYEEVGLLSLSSGDYGCLNLVVDGLLTRWGDEKVALSLPSLRTETMSAELAEKISRVRKTGFTLAPEAATERMRAVINKGNREEDLLSAVESVFSSGWSLLKLYFMIGLPEERDEDVVAIAQLAKKALAVARRSLSGKRQAVIHLGASTFVPKPFTPFQWEPMISQDEIRRRQALITAELGGRHGAIQFKPHDPRQSSIEGALAIGDRRVGTAILHAYSHGQRFDGWSEWFKEQNWIDAFAECERVYGVGLDFFAHRRRPVDEVLPWDRIDCGVAQSYLEEQATAARCLTEVQDCVGGPCTSCGVCDGDLIQNRIYTPSDYEPGEPPPIGRTATPVRTHIRIRYGKLGRLVALSHLETVHSLQRAMRRAGLPIAYSQGFHPKPRVSFGPALPVGIESRCEYIDLELEGATDPAALDRALRPQLPDGIVFLGAELIDPATLSLSESIRAMHYRAVFPSSCSAELLSAQVGAFEAAQRVLIKRSASKKAASRKRGHNVAVTREKDIDLKAIVTHLAIEGPGEVAFSLKADPGGSAKPAEVLAAIFGVGIAPTGVTVLKEGVSFTRTAEDRRQAAQPRAPRYSDA